MMTIKGSLVSSFTDVKRFSVENRKLLNPIKNGSKIAYFEREWDLKFCFSNHENAYPCAEASFDVHSARNTPRERLGCRPT